MFSLSQRRMRMVFSFSVVVHYSVFRRTEDAENMFSHSLRKLNQFANLSLQPLSLGNSEKVCPQLLKM
jgi:hypothetical protein